MRLDQTLGDREAEAHAGGRRIDANELLEDLLVKLRGDTRTRVRDRNQDAIGTLATAAAAFLGRGLWARRRSQKWGTARNVTRPPAGV